MVQQQRCVPGAACSASLSPHSPSTTMPATLAAGRHGSTTAGVVVLGFLGSKKLTTRSLKVLPPSLFERWQEGRCRVEVPGPRRSGAVRWRLRRVQRLAVTK